MKTFLTFGLLMTLGMTAGAAQPKNLAAPTFRATVATSAARQLSEREARRLSATAETAAQHLRLAGFYAARANQLDAQGAAYEKAVADTRNRAAIKNFVAPTTAGRYEQSAKESRRRASAERAFSVMHEQLASEVSAKF